MGEPSKERVSEPTITEILAGLGFSHRGVSGSISHELTHIASGERIGWYSAGDAIAAAEAYLAAQHANPQPQESAS